LEESLSVDNMMLFLLIFTTLGIPHKYQHKVLSVGIVSAIVMRIFVILIGSSLLENFQWMIYVFGGILLLGAFKMILQRKEQKIDISKNMSVKILKKIVPIQTKITDNRFFTKTNGVLYATPLFVALIVIEMTDLVFAMDSIPAVLAVTTDPFIVITSNIFAISGLRALYFLISNVVHKFYYLKIGLIILLFFIGIKMIISEIYEISTFVSFLIIVLILGLVIAASMARSYKKPKNI
jgi:tellurite resistance protein TerC